jgi:4-hydroxy-3-methylbut-2-enyl diphosphate reductase
MSDTKIMVNALKACFSSIQEQKQDDICYATQNRQDAVHDLAELSDIILIVGSPNSSNSNRLCEIAEQLGKPAYLIDTYQDMDQHWFDQIKVIGVTAGASAPEILVQEVIKQLQIWGATIATEHKGIEETVVFSLPKNLKKHLNKT